MRFGVHPKRIKHLARYFGVVGFFCLAGYGFTDYSYYFLSVLAPSFFLVYWLRTYGAALTSILPHEPLYNNLLLVFAALIYFGLVGFQLKNILNERGKIRLIILAAFLGFLFYIHRLSFSELSLYWPEAEKPAAFAHSADRGPARDRPLGDDQR